jgi:hypothetical protein
MPDTEQVDLKLPSGEMVTAVVPAGYSDDQVKLLMRLKRPDLLGGQLPAPMPKAPYEQPQQMQGSSLAQAVYGPPLQAGEEMYRENKVPPPSQVNPVSSSAAMVAGPVALAGGVPQVRSAVVNAAKAAPTIAAMEAIQYARHNLPGGKYIPPGAEWLPVFMGGRGKAAAPAETTAAETAAGVEKAAAEAVPAETQAAANTAARASTVPRTLAGEGILNEALTSLDNKALLSVAKSRGINVTQEAQLKPGVANQRIIKKIIDDFSPEELDNARNIGIETERFGPARIEGLTSDQAREVWHTRVLNTFFPDVKISAAQLARTSKAMSAIEEFRKLQAATAK